MGYIDAVQLVQNVREGVDFIESPPLNARLLLGFPDVGPTMWINDELIDMADAQDIADTASGCNEIEKRPFTGKNGLTYYRYILKSADE